MRSLLVLGVLAACGGAPQFAHTTPPALPAAAVPAPAAHVRLELRSTPWWTAVGDDARFLLGMPAAPVATPGRTLGAIRSADVSLDDAGLAAAACAWSLAGDRPCSGPRIDAMAAVHDPIERALDELRARAGAAGANLAGDVRCFAARAPGHLWCEGVARVAAQDPGGLEDDPAAPTADPPLLAPTRLALVADGSVAMAGRVPVIGSSVGLRYHPLELTFDVLDLSHDGTTRGLVGVGGTAMARIALRRQLDAIAGGSAAAVAPNGSVNPTFTGRYAAFGGLSYQSSWRFRGIAQPWIELRAGAVRAAGATSPMIGVHLGLSTPTF